MSTVVPDDEGLIHEELNLPFRWYDDVLKQNRYNTYCQQSCKFKLITPCDRFLPFQIKTPEGVFPLVQWIVYDIDGVQVLDLSACIASHLEVKTVNGTDYIIFEDQSLLNCGFNLECGSYYSMINDGVSYFYSEIFEVVHFSEVLTSQVIFQPHLPWRWYDDQEKQNRFKTNCAQNCDFYLLSSNERLLPFQFRRESAPDGVDSFYLRDISDNSCGFTLEPSLVQIYQIGEYDYFIYDGVAISDLPCGIYEAVIISGGQTFYSEIIKIIDAVNEGNFLLQEDGYKILQENTDGILLEQ